MFGTQNINQYKKISIETGVEAANPIELIIMLYDGAIVSCYSAIPYVQKMITQTKVIIFLRPLELFNLVCA